MTENIQNYHAHLYFTEDQIPIVHDVLEKVKNNYGYEVGRVWGSPVGPHPIGSCQILVPPEGFGEFINWLMFNRKGLDVFVHATTGDGLRDHTEHVMWLGRSYELKLDIF